MSRLSLCYVEEGLMLDPMCDTPHVQVTIVALQRSSKVAESVDSIPMRSARGSAVLNAVQPTVRRSVCMNGLCCLLFNGTCSRMCCFRLAGGIEEGKTQQIRWCL